jgi:hypothetical protein
MIIIIRLLANKVIHTGSTNSTVLVLVPVLLIVLGPSTCTCTSSSSNGPPVAVANKWTAPDGPDVELTHFHSDK